MGYDRNAPKRPINVELNADLVRQAREYTKDLSVTLEELLKDFVAREASSHLAEDSALDGVICGFNAFHQKHGLLSDEFSTLRAASRYY